ncbi:MAG: 1-acyl-sn-glycerol-3-phosphate acyltransferase [Erysipelotrichaceae bacterium]|nr:1-acyl-sn-glycerol-3-phosphate acyltransferase [Erysipelotrichaceae bacterium]
MNNAQIRKGLKRHVFVYHFLRILIGWIIKAICSFSYVPYTIREKPVLILSNHNSDFDPLLMVISLKKHFKFVASANIMSGFIGKIIAFLVGPIPREKGASADDTVGLIIDNLNAGIDVAMFPEGNKSWDGSTNFISKRTAEIFKKARCGLVTYRFEGGYLRSPRWSRYSRKGKLIGRVVNEYSYQQLEDLSVDEIYEIIVRDLQADAFQYQQANRLRYSGKALAEGIENLTYLCPVCHRFDSIHSQGNEFSCDCGMKGVYDEYGYLSGEGIADYNNTVKWNSFQKKWLISHKEQLKRQTDKPISHDEGLSLYEIVNNERILLKDSLNSDIYGDRIFISSGDFSLTLYWRQILKVGMFRNNALYLTYGDKRYELYRSGGFSLIKYFSLSRVLTDKSLV